MFSSNRNILWTLGKRIGKTSLITNSQAISSRQEERINAHRQTNSKPINGIRENSAASSTIPTIAKQERAETPCFSEEELTQFMDIFPDIVRDLTDSYRPAEFPDFTKRFAKVLQCNVPNNEHLLGLPTVVCYKALEKPENLTFGNMVLANVIGWCVEMLISWIVIFDDVIDKSPRRYNRPSWYTQKDVGLMAISDALMIEACIHTLLRKYLGDKKCYTYILEQFRAVSTEMIIGQTMDMMFKTPDGTPSLHLFTMSRYKTKTKYSIGSISSLPMSLAMYLANIYDHKQHTQAKRISLEMGELFQMQNDFLDCFGNPEGTGKESSDIKEGKCTWLAVVALEKATSAQKKVMEEHFGKEDEKDIQKIKDLYLELDLPGTYTTAEEELQTHVQQSYNGQIQEALLKLLKQRYNFKNTRLRDIC